MRQIGTEYRRGTGSADRQKMNRAEEVNVGRSNPMPKKEKTPVDEPLAKEPLVKETMEELVKEDLEKVSGGTDPAPAPEPEEEKPKKKKSGDITLPETP